MDVIWISIDERLPDKDDNDGYNNVWAYHKSGVPCMVCWASDHENDALRTGDFSHWARTGVERPDVPTNKPGDEF